MIAHTPVLFVRCCLIGILVAVSEVAVAAQPLWSLDAEVDQGAVTSNTVQRFNNPSATRFDTTEFTQHAITSGRLTLTAPVGAAESGRELRAAIVPLQVSGAAVAGRPIVFDGQSFSGERPLTVLYQFNTYRITYDVPLFRSTLPAGWEIRAGGTLALRDAQTRLKQGSLRRNYVNYGPVPLAFASVRRAYGDSFAWEADLETFPAPGGGGLLDTSGRAVWSPTGAQGPAFYTGVRYLAGGATQDSVFNFLHVRTALIGVRVPLGR